MSLKNTLKKYRHKFCFVLFLILLEAGLSILFPLFIGYAIDDAINRNHQGAICLGLLGLAVLIIGVGRRVFDSRFYAKVYQSIGTSAISSIKNHVPSKKSARLGMIRELVEFLENALPELISNIIGLIGVIGIIATLNLNAFYGSLITTFVIFLIYWVSSTKTIKLNKSSNDEFEKQVDVISKNDEKELNLHLRAMMKWNIKLSDLEAINFSISWMVLIAFLVASIVISVDDGIVKYGALFSFIMYVFQYMENVVNLPLFYQNWLRLQEIRERLIES
ncbi:ABC transporter six-transmembrane domain-containing protein [Flammeovirga sp. OC4]|uniref:ABC transporter six-transmembrane domain-containing protein n=1 Tax=Flammeovirga sp. OC4 TaxID=1382345 RepID=UPI00155DB24F|nr:ABC transporter six-transmembrane domain-containing protein [Flammeovirga sp. OC4]